MARPLLLALLALAVPALAQPTVERVADLHPGPGSSTPTGFVAFDGATFFVADDGTHGRELWRTDGTEAGTELVRDIRPGPDASNPQGFLVIGGTMYFSANDGTTGTELWKTDGTAAGTVLVEDLRPGADGSLPGGFADLDGTLFFSANDGTHGLEPWRSDGTAAGTVLVKDIRPGDAGSRFGSPAVFGGEVYFAASDGTTGFELWKTDGTGAGTVLVRDVQPGAGSSLPTRFETVGGALLFTADDGTHGLEYWRTDGTEAGTALVLDLNPGSANGYFDSACGADRGHLDGDLYFPGFVSGSPGALSLWRTDGTAAGTAPVAEVGIPCGVVEYDGALYFRNTLSSEVWRSDGTTAGTGLLAQTDLLPNGFTPFGGLLYFVAGGELWTSDGTAAGTQLAADLNPTGVSMGAGTFLYVQRQFAPVGSSLFFRADDGTSGDELWRVATVGTAGETGPAAGALALHVAPNPVRGAAAATVRQAAPARAARVALLDALGREVAVLHEGPLSSGTHTFPLRAPALAPGLYLLRATTADGAATSRATVVR